MKKYYNFSEAPLKFHSIYHPIIMPLSIIYSLLNTYFYVKKIAIPNLNAAFVFDIVIMIGSILLFTISFILFFKWHRFGWYCYMSYLFLVSISATISTIILSIIVPAELPTHIGKFIGTVLIVIPLAIYYNKRKPLFFNTSNSSNYQGNSIGETKDVVINPQNNHNTVISQEKAADKESLEISEKNYKRVNIDSTYHGFRFRKYGVPMILILLFIIIIVQSVFIYNQTLKIDQLSQQVEIINNEISPLINAEDQNGVRFRSIDQQMTNVRKSLSLIEKDINFLKYNTFGSSVQPLKFDELYEYYQMIKGENN